MGAADSPWAAARAAAPSAIVATERGWNCNKSAIRHQNLPNFIDPPQTPSANNERTFRRAESEIVTELDNEAFTLVSQHVSS